MEKENLLAGTTRGISNVLASTECCTYFLGPLVRAMQNDGTNIECIK